MGCASLGSRISKRDGILALDRAFAAGVNWFDLAPSYGDGECESVFADFATGKRDQIHICTKFGIAPSKLSGWKKMLKPAARLTFQHIAPLRRVIAAQRFPETNLSITGASILRDLERSLKRIQTDYVDSFAFHAFDHDMLSRDDILSAIDRIINEGKARVVGVATYANAVAAALGGENAIQHVQFSASDWPVVKQHIAEDGKFARKLESAFVVQHSVMSINVNQIDQALRAEFAAKIGDYLSEPALRILLALSQRNSNVTLLSMFDQRHLKLATELWKKV